MQDTQSNNRPGRSSQYIPGKKKLRPLNADVPPVHIKSNNETMSRMKAKSFSVTRRVQKGPTNTSSKAVAKSTSGRPGAARNITGKTSMVNSSRVKQISPAQKSAKQGATSKTVASNPTGQNKKPRSNGPSLGSFKKSIRKTMGY